MAAPARLPATRRRRHPLREPHFRRTGGVDQQTRLIFRDPEVDVTELESPAGPERRSAWA